MSRNCVEQFLEVATHAAVSHEVHHSTEYFVAHIWVSLKCSAQSKHPGMSLEERIR